MENLKVGDMVKYIGNFSGDVDVENFMRSSSDKIYTVEVIELDRNKFTGVFWVKGSCGYALDVQDFKKVTKRGILEGTLEKLIDSDFEGLLNEMMYSDLSDIEIKAMSDWDNEFDGVPFREQYDIVLDNNINLDAEYLINYCGEWYSYPDGMPSYIEDDLKRKLFKHIMDLDNEIWDEVAFQGCVDGKIVSIKSIREELKTQKFSINFVAVLEPIEVEADSESDAYEKALEKLRSLAKDVPLKNIVNCIRGADVYGENNHLRCFDDCFDEI